MPRHLQDQSIVIVEDDLEIGQTLKDFFGDHNTVQTFPSAEDALAAESSLGSVSVFILDYRLPGKDGIELFQHFRIVFPKAKYILITGEMSFDMVESTREIGLDALILKPFDFTILEENIIELTATATP